MFKPPKSIPHKIKNTLKYFINFTIFPIVINYYLIFICVYVCLFHSITLELPQIEQFQFNPNGVNGGQAVRVMCMVTSGDLPLDIYWLKDGQPLLRSIYHKIDEYTLILSLRQTNIGDIGNYTCVASNKAGEARKWSTLKVKGKKSQRENID